jgi:Fe-S cluster assembly ATP-binding protein
MSGGEKKRNELLQLSFFEPKFAVLDEIDSGLDIDAWGKAMQFIKAEQERVGFGLVIVTHYAKTAKFFTNAMVHVIEKGSCARSGGVELAEMIDAHGFGAIES